MAEDLYSILGVSREASQDEIKRHYRKLAKELHPDLNPGDEAIAERFKRVSAAHAILADPKKRASYDLGEIDETGDARHSYGGYRDFSGGHRQRGGQFDEETLQDLFSEMFGSRGGGSPFQRPARGGDLSYKLRISFLEAVKGAKKRVVMGDGQTLDLTVPVGIQEGQMLRLKGKGRPGAHGGPPGDARVELHIDPHPRFERRDRDIHLDLPIGLHEAVLGAKIDVPTIDGPVTMTIPKGSNSGATLRLKGKGIGGPKGGARGNQFVHLNVVLPKSIDDDLEEFVERWRDEHAYDAREGWQKDR
ncbi:MAG: DnaJ C-terminal domain-containing protein [Geminicoccaceae bacterium]